MQVNFFMADEDRRAFHEFLYSRDAYLTPERWPTQIVPLVGAHSSELDSCRTLKIFKSDLFPQSKFQDPAWVTRHAPTNSFFVHGPGIQYDTSFTDADGIHRGRLYMGLVSESSFIEPHISRAGTNGRHKLEYNALENFYKSCVRYLRKNYRRDGVGMYHGVASDAAVANSAAIKLQIRAGPGCLNS